MTLKITLTLNDKLIHKAEIIATRQSLPIRQILNDIPARAIIQLDFEQYEQAKQAAFQEMDKGFYLGSMPASMESLYER